MCPQFRSFQVLSGGNVARFAGPNGVVVEAEARLGRLLLQHEEPAGAGERLVARQVEADERHVGVERAAEDRMALERRRRRPREIGGEHTPAVVHRRP